MTAQVHRLAPEPPPGDAELVRRIRGGEKPLFEALMRRYNQRLFRIARALLRDDAEAEDVLQDGYVRAYANLSQLSDLSRLEAWLAHIVLHEAKARLRRRRQVLELAAVREGGTVRDPEDQVAALQLQRLLIDAVDALPLGYRTVFMLREIEGMSTAEVAQTLALREEAVKTRLHRARAALRDGLYQRVGAAALRAFKFGGVRCDRVVAGVLRRI